MRNIEIGCVSFGLLSAILGSSNCVATIVYTRNREPRPRTHEKPVSYLSRKLIGVADCGTIEIGELENTIGCLEQHRIYLYRIPIQSKVRQISVDMAVEIHFDQSHKGQLIITTVQSHTFTHWLNRIHYNHNHIRCTPQNHPNTNEKPTECSALISHTRKICWPP